jgi:hypothetical protein
MKKYNNHKQKFSASKNIGNQRNLSFGVKLSVILGGVMVFIGLAFTVIGLAFIIPFALSVNYDGLKISKDSPTTSGQLINVSPTNSYVNDIRVYEYSYEYYVRNEKHTGLSYKPGEYELANIRIQYVEDSPEISRIEGMESSTFPMWFFLLIGIFPITGGIMLYAGLKKRLMYLKILQIGKVTFGVFDRMETTGASINSQNVYKMFFNYVAEDQKVYQAFGETHKTHRLKDEQFEPLVFNPANPEEAIMIDGLPNSVRKVLTDEIAQAKISFGK